MLPLALSLIAAIALVAVAVHAVIKRRTAASSALLLTALLLACVEVFDDLFLGMNIKIPRLRQLSVIAESLLPGSFLFLTLLYGRIKPFSTQTKIRLGIQFVAAFFPILILALAGTDLYYSPKLQAEQALFLTLQGFWFYLGIMTSLIISLTNIEITLTSTSGMTRYQIKFEVFGIISLLSVLIFYYSQALLYRTIDVSLGPIRSSILVIAALLIGYSNFYRGNGVPVSISRYVFYRSFTLLLIGIYLIGLAVIGEGMRYFDISFRRHLTIIFAFAGGLLVLAILYSEKARRRAKVYIHKHFFGNQHDYRKEWINLTACLSSTTTRSDIEQAVLTAYREAFGFAGGSLYLLSRDEKRYICAARQSMEIMPAELRLSAELYAYFMDKWRVLNLCDQEHPLTSEEVSRFRQGQAFLVVPLITKGRLEGLVALREQLVSQILIYDDYDLMKVMAGQAANAIANFRLSDENTEMRAMAAVARISSFVIHDLKNLTSSLSLVVDNAREHIGKPDFQQDAIRTISNTLAKMKHLTQRLKAIPEKATLKFRVQDVDLLSRETIVEFSRIRPELKVECIGSPAFAAIDEEEIKKVLMNLVQNAIEATGEQGWLRVKTCRENGSICIQISDNGAGISDDFLKNNLFRPFQTTKKNGLGIGLYQCRQIVEAHGGHIEVTSEVGKGSSFTIMLPVSEPDKAGR